MRHLLVSLAVLTAACGSDAIAAHPPAAPPAPVAGAPVLEAGSPAPALALTARVLLIPPTSPGTRGDL